MERIIKERVHGEITPVRIDLGGLGEFHAGRPAAVRGEPVLAERGDLDVIRNVRLMERRVQTNLGFRGRGATFWATQRKIDHSERSSNKRRGVKDRENLFRES